MLFKQIMYLQIMSLTFPFMSLRSLTAGVLDCLSQARHSLNEAHILLFLCCFNEIPDAG